MNRTSSDGVWEVRLDDQSPDADQLNVGVRERGESSIPKLLPTVFEAILLATHSTPRNTTPVHAPGGMEGCQLLDGDRGAGIDWRWEIQDFCLQNVKFKMPSRYPSGKDRKLYVQVLSSEEEVRTVDMQAGITGIHTTFQAMRAGVITWEEHTVKEGSQSRALERTVFGGGMWGPSKGYQREAASVKG